MDLKKVIAFAAALMLVASGGAALPKLNFDVAYASNDSYPAADGSSSYAEPVWSESEDEANVRALEHTFDTFIVFKDGNNMKLDIEYEHELKKDTSRSYDEFYKKTLSLEEIEKLIAEKGKTYSDVDRIEYRLKFSNTDETNYGDEYMVWWHIYSVTYLKSIDHRINAGVGYNGNSVVQNINKTQVFNAFDFQKTDVDKYDSIDLDFKIDYAGAKVYVPTEAHKRAMQVTFKPTFDVMLKDGTKIPVKDEDYTEKSGYCEDYYYDKEITAEQLKKIITDAGKDPADFHCFFGYLTPIYPENSGISDETVMMDIDANIHQECRMKPEYTGIGVYPGDHLDRTIKFSDAPFTVGECNYFEGTVIDQTITETGEDGVTYQTGEPEEVTLDHVESIMVEIHVFMHDARILSDDDSDTDSRVKPVDTSSKPDDTSSNPDNDSSKSDDSSKPEEKEPTPEEQAAAEKLGTALSYSVEASILCKDGTEIPTKLVFRQSIGKGIEYTADITHEEIVKLLEDAGKTIDDFKTFVFDVNTALPSFSNVDGSTKVKIGGSVRWDAADGGGQASMSFSFKDTLDTKNRASLMNYKDMVTADKAKLSFIVKSAAVYAPDADIDIRETRRLGDINNDGKRNAGDIAKIAAHVKGVKTLSAEDKEFADLNKDGKVNSADIVTLAAGIKGLKHLD